MKSILNFAHETLIAVREKQARARLLSQLDERTLRDIGLEQEANRARERSRAGYMRFGLY
jgi:uncharacterized protein YjiS (DUF1127 family)